MSTLLFYDDSHKYTVDGEEVPSVSELTRFLTREMYSEVPQYVLDNAAQRGTKIHKATEALDVYGKVEIDSDLVDYLKAYVSFRKEVNPEWEKIEWSVCNDKLYAGTLDRYGLVGGVPTILDVKTTASITGLHKVVYTAQLNLYRLAVMKEKPVEALTILQLRKDGTYKLYPIEVNEPLAQACITMHEAIKNAKKRRKKKNAESRQQEGTD